MFNKNRKTLLKNEPTALEREFLSLGHLIKYNLYLLSKSLIFSAVSQKVDDLNLAAQKTNEIINELDLDTKRRMQEGSVKE